MNCVTIAKPQRLLGPVSIPNRLLMGAGPSNMFLDIVHSLSQPLLGHLHPEFIQVYRDFLLLKNIGVHFSKTLEIIFCTNFSHF